MVVFCGGLWLVVVLVVVGLWLVVGWFLSGRLVLLVVWLAGCGWLGVLFVVWFVFVGWCAGRLVVRWCGCARGGCVGACCVFGRLGLLWFGLFVVVVLFLVWCVLLFVGFGSWFWSVCSLCWWSWCVLGFGFLVLLGLTHVGPSIEVHCKHAVTSMAVVIFN